MPRLVAQSDTIARRWRITGRVQGVGFRWFVLGHARTLGLRGTVRNLAGGAVQVEAAGAAEALERLETHLRQGPLGAAVGGVTSEVAVVTTAGFAIVSDEEH